jgi:hypothetical protein
MCGDAKPSDAGKCVGATFFCFCAARGRGQMLDLLRSGVPATREGHDARQFRQHSDRNITNPLKRLQICQKEYKYEQLMTVTITAYKMLLLLFHAVS